MAQPHALGKMGERYTHTISNCVWVWVNTKKEISQLVLGFLLLDSEDKINTLSVVLYKTAPRTPLAEVISV